MAVDKILKSVSEKNKYSLKSLFILGFLGGAFIALGGVLAVLVAGNLSELNNTTPGLVKLIFGGVFPLGLILVVVAGAELFTGNNSFYVIALWHKKSSFLELLKNWIIIFFSNFIGALFVAYFLADQSELLNESQIEFIQKIGVYKVNLSFKIAFLRAVGCNWLVCLALWMSFKTESITGKVLLIWFPIMAFVAIGYEHSIANQFFIPLAFFSGAEITLEQFLVSNLIPVTLGNIVGGGFFVGFLYAYSSSIKSE